MGDEYEVIINVERRTKFKHDQGLVFENGEPVIEHVQNENGLIFWARCAIFGRDIYLSDTKTGPFPNYNGFTVVDAARIAHEWAKFFGNRYSVSLVFDDTAKAALKAIEGVAEDGI